MMNKQQKKFLRRMIVAGAIFGVFFGAGAGLTQMIVHRADQADDPKTQEEETLTRQDGERTNLLLLGVDARPGETVSRSDTMIMVSVDPKLNKAAVISIPRDTRVSMKGPYDKVCAANVVGGPEYAASVVEDLLDVNIDYWVEMDFNGFKRIVDTLGGVTVNVPERMYKSSEGIDLQPGVQKLYGSQALGFVRYRDYALADIERTKQQQVFMKALADEVLKPKTIAKLPKLISDLNQCVETNMKVTDMLRMASWAPGFDSESIVAQTLPGSFYDQVDENGILLQSYWQVDRQKVAKLLDTMLSGKTVAVVQGGVQTPSVKKPTPSEDEDENEDENESTPPQDSSDLDEQRSRLPSPGHGVPAPSAPSAGISGPEGYI